MKMKLFADVAGTTRIDIPELDIWIECKNELSIGEERKTFAGAVKGQTTTPDGTRVEYDAAKLSFGLVQRYVIDWSARDERDKPVKFSDDALRALTPEAYHLIEEAVDAHKERVKAGNAPTQSTSGAALTSVSAA